MTPALAVIALATPRAREIIRFSELRSIARKTAVLWVVGVVYLVVRAANGAPPDSGPYAARLFGSHLFRNAKDLLQDAARFGVPLSTPVARIWDLVFWATIIVGSFVALKRQRYVPVAGLVWFAVACLPVLTLTNHGIDAYYLDFALVGLALTLAGLARTFIKSGRAIVVVALCFVVVQIGAVQRYDDTASINLAIRRSVALAHLARTLPSHDHVLIVSTHCPQDRELSKQGELFRAVRGDSHLTVHFQVRQPHRC